MLIEELTRKSEDKVNDDVKEEKINSLYGEE